jgi:osmotically-inducible protein OsmY
MKFLINQGFPMNKFLFVPFLLTLFAGVNADYSTSSNYGYSTNNSYPDRYNGPGQIDVRVNRGYQSNTPYYQGQKDQGYYQDSDRYSDMRYSNRMDGQSYNQGSGCQGPYCNDKYNQNQSRDYQNQNWSNQNQSGQGSYRDGMQNKYNRPTSEGYIQDRNLQAMNDRDPRDQNMGNRSMNDDRTYDRDTNYRNMNNRDMSDERMYDRDANYRNMNNRDMTDERINNQNYTSNQNPSTTSHSRYSTKYPQDKYNTENDREINEKIRKKITGWFTDDYLNISIDTENGKTSIGGFVDNQDALDDLKEDVKKVQPNATINVQVRPYNKP